MNRYRIHPLWVHLPALAAFTAMLVYLIVSLPLPATTAVHFGPGGVPDRYGSPWQVFGIFIGLSLLFVGISGLLDELWARQEDRKRFNWLSLLDDLVVGGMSGFAIAYLNYLDNTGTAFTFPWTWFGTVTGITVVLAVLLEMVRPYRPWREPVQAPEDRGLREEIAGRIRRNAGFVYWDYQNPWYVSVVTTVLPLVMLGAAVITWMEMWWVAAIVAVVGLAMVIPYGGMRTLVTRESVIVRFGLLGIPVLRLDTADIATAEPHRFSPLRDFGGYGIRFNREMKAYYLSGTSGVKITLASGKKYLIGSDHAADLAAVVAGVAAA